MKLIWPFSVYLIALVKKLIIISLIFPASPYNTGGILGSIFEWNSIGFPDVSNLDFDSEITSS